MNKVWRDRLYERLAQTGQVGEESVRYLREHNVRLSFRKYSKNTGARWFLFQTISLNSRYYSVNSSLDNPKLLSLLVHEVHHLRQGTWTAFSVYGELDAWQVEYRFYKTLKPGKLHPALEEILAFPLNFERENLRRAAKLMQDYAGKGYRIHLYPLYPFPQEISYWFTRREPK